MYNGNNTQKPYKYLLKEIIETIDLLEAYIERLGVKWAYICMKPICIPVKQVHVR